MGEIVVLGRIYRRLVVAKIRSDWQYRASFVMFTISQFFITFMDFLAIRILFANVPRLAGWTLWEVAFLYGIAGITFFVCDVFVSQVEMASQHIRMGTFDRFLVRPLGPLFQLSTDEFAFRRFGKLLQATIVFLLATAGAGIDWTPGRLLMVPVALVSGSVIFGAIWVMSASVAFWLVDTEEAAHAVTYGGNYMSQYPLEIYGTWLRRFFTFVVPTAFIAYFPALYILGRNDPFGSPRWLQFSSPVVALAAFLVARAVWTLGVRHYRSTGS